MKTFLVLTAAALDLTVVPWSVRANELVLYPQLSNCFLKKSWNISLTVGKAVGKLKTVVRFSFILLPFSFHSVQYVLYSYTVRLSTNQLTTP